MDWLQSIFEAENGSPVQLITITVCIILLLLVFGWIFRKIAGTAANKRARNRMPRLSITDWASVGERHQLVLVRRDNVEHLLLIGGNSDIVVEQNIVRVQSASKQAEQPLVSTTSQPTEQEVTADKSKDGLVADMTAPVTAAAAAVAGTVVAAQSEPDEKIETISSDTAETVQSEATEVTEAVSVENLASESDNKIPAEAESAVTADNTAEIANTAEFETDLIASISESLEENSTPEVASAKDAAQVSTAPAVEDASSMEAANGEDEMQRLLDELAGEVKNTVDTKELA